MFCVSNQLYYSLNVLFLLSNFLLISPPSPYLLSIIPPVRLLSVKDTENKMDTFLPGDYGITMRVSHTGAVQRSPSYLLYSSCLISIKNFPFDTQRCEIIISTWSYTYKTVCHHSLIHVPHGSFFIERIFMGCFGSLLNLTLLASGNFIL